jgi:hypothetical protein
MAGKFGLAIEFLADGYTLSGLTVFLRLGDFASLGGASPI